MKENDLIVPANLKLKACRTPNRSKPRPERPNQWWGIDMTKVMIAGFGWVYVVIVLDWHTKKVVGHYAGVRSKAEHWLLALEMAVNAQFPNGVRDQGLNLMSDNGNQPTSLSFMRACSVMGMNQAFTSYNNPKGNADTERFMRTLKEELAWINEFRSAKEFFNALDLWINEYNNSYLHSALGYLSPKQFETNFYKQKIPMFCAC
jgi:transposase InsO family protein